MDPEAIAFAIRTYRRKFDEYVGLEVWGYCIQYYFAKKDPYYCCYLGDYAEIRYEDGILAVWILAGDTWQISAKATQDLLLLYKPAYHERVFDFYLQIL